jgi:hypothetical protein
VAASVLGAVVAAWFLPARPAGEVDAVVADDRESSGLVELQAA